VEMVGAVAEHEDVNRVADFGGEAEEGRTVSVAASAGACVSIGVVPELYCSQMLCRQQKHTSFFALRRHCPTYQSHRQVGRVRELDMCLA
jgi:hypothetical protein